MFPNTKKNKEREKKFLKLKQLDRIEYMIKLRDIRDSFQTSFFEIVNVIVTFNIVLFLFATLFLIAFKSVTLLQILPTTLKISIVILVFFIVFDILQNALRIKNIFKLRERFNLN